MIKIKEFKEWLEAFAINFIWVGKMILGVMVLLGSMQGMLAYAGYTSSMTQDSFGWLGFYFVMGIILYGGGLLANFYLTMPIKSDNKK